MESCLLYATWPEASAAEACAEALVEARLAACVSVLPQARSIYRWQGKVERAQEALMLVKTSGAMAGAARDRIVAMHPYDLPCVLALPLAAGASHAPFLDWVEAETG